NAGRLGGSSVSEGWFAGERIRGDRRARAARDRRQPRARRYGEAVLVRFVRDTRQRPEDRPQPENGPGSSYHAAPRPRVPGEQHHEAAHQRRALAKKGGRIAGEI